MDEARRLYAEVFEHHEKRGRSLLMCHVEALWVAIIGLDEQDVGTLRTETNAYLDERERAAGIEPVDLPDL